MKIGHFSKLMKLNIHLLLCSKRHYIDEIEYPPSPTCGEKPQFESNVTSFQFRQNALAQGWPSATPSPRRFGGENLLLFKKQVPSTTTILMIANFFVCSKLENY